MKSEAEIDALMTTAVEAGLDGLDFMAGFTYEQLAAGYNGIGPSFLTDRQRENLTRYLSLFAPAALIHDMRYDVSDGSRRGFNYANFEFRANCYSLAAQTYGVFNWRRYRAYAVAELLFTAVASQAGWVAWREAFTKNLTQNIKET